jgi:hypothetical protein
MSNISKIFKVIGHLFTNLFNEARKAFNKLSPEQQQALRDGTGLAALINSMLDKTPAEIRAAIATRFPNLDEPLVEAAIFKLAERFGLPHMTTLETMIELIKERFASAQGEAWEQDAHLAGLVFSAAFAPKGTRTAAIISLLEYVYHDLVRPLFFK